VHFEDVEGNCEYYAKNVDGKGEAEAFTCHEGQKSAQKERVEVSIELAGFLHHPVDTGIVVS
jgi:hypothetical protein